MVVAVALAACDAPAEEQLIPDARLQAELGLTARDRVHTVVVRTGVGERPDPLSLEIRDGDLVQFVSGDWMVHEVHFVLDSMQGARRDFLERTGQTDSPPLLQREARFVLTFEGAPPGRYPYRLEGNREPGEGVIVVLDSSSR